MRERDDPIGPDRMEGGTGGKEKETKEGKKKKKKRLRMGPLVCAGGGEGAQSMDMDGLTIHVDGIITRREKGTRL